MQKTGNNRPIHILFIVENNAVPTDIRVWREAKTAQSSGYCVTIISPKNKKYPRSYEVREGITIYRHPTFYLKSGIFNQVIEYCNAILWELILCFYIFVNNRFDIVHGANPPDHIFIFAILFRIFGVKYIFDHHDLAPELYACKFKSRGRSVFRILRIMEKMSCKTSNAIISTNDSYKRHVIETHRVDPKKVWIVRNDPEAPVLVQKLNPTFKKNGQVSKLIYVGSINFQDGLDILIRVVHFLVNNLGQKNVLCTIIGDGEYLAMVKQLCNELCVTPYIDFKGYVYERKMVQKYIENADICLDTAPNSDVNRKSTFIKIMEYMAAAKPVVAFDLDETRFTVDNSEILIKPEKIDLFAKAIENLINDPLKRESIGKALQKRIIEKLNWNEASQSLLSLYKSLN